MTFNNNLKILNISLPFEFSNLRTNECFLMSYFFSPNLCGTFLMTSLDRLPVRKNLASSKGA